MPVIERHELQDLNQYQVEVPEQKDNFLEQLMKTKIKQDLNYNNAYEQVVRQRTRDEFVDFLRFKERVMEERSLKQLEDKGIIRVDWGAYNGTESEEERKQKERDDRVMKYAMVVGFAVGVLFMIF